MTASTYEETTRNRNAEEEEEESSSEEEDSDSSSEEEYEDDSSSSEEEEEDQEVSNVVVQEAAPLTEEEEEDDDDDDEQINPDPLSTSARRYHREKSCLHLGAASRTSSSSSNTTRKDPLLLQDKNHGRLFPVFAVLLFLGIVGGTYQLNKGQEDRIHLPGRFQEHVKPILSTFAQDLQSTIESLQQLGTFIQQNARDNNQTWPFVHFYIDGPQQQQQQQASDAVLAPLVRPAQWKDFQKHLARHDDDVLETTPEVMSSSKQDKITAPRFIPSQYINNSTEIVQEWYHDSSFFSLLQDILPQIQQQQQQQQQQGMLMNSTTFMNDIHHTYLIQPVYETTPKKRFLFLRPKQHVQEVVALLATQLHLQTLLQRAFHSVNGPAAISSVMAVMVQDTDTTTYQVTHHEASYLGQGDLHLPHYDDCHMTISLHNNALQLQLHLYPTIEMERNLLRKSSMDYYCSVVAALLLYGFLVYAAYIYYQQQEYLRSLEHYQQQEHALCQQQQQDVESPTSELIGQVFPSAIIVMVDIVGIDQWDMIGFDSWDLERDLGESVKLLLELILVDMNEVATKYAAIKVEAIGSAVTFFHPTDPVVMAEFARELAIKMPKWFSDLKYTHGPKILALQGRIGLHQGTVVAAKMADDGGHLEPGSSNSFQVLGETVEFAARLEQACQGGCIHVSRKMAESLKERGKELWLEEETSVNSKHLGEPTYGLLVASTLSEASSSSNPAASRDIPAQSQSTAVTTTTASTSAPKNQEVEEDDAPEHNPTEYQYPEIEMSPNEVSRDELSYESMDESYQHRQMVIEMATKKERLIEWSVDVLCELLEEVLAARGTSQTNKSLAELEDQLGKGSNVLDQAKEYISMPVADKNELKNRKHTGSVALTDAALRQLREYVNKIASYYHDNAFHNYEHASYVTASVRKMLSQMETTQDNEDQSFGIQHDPLVKFSLVFCALVHDVDHPGVPNSQLVKEKSPMAAVYKKKSIAEQNSVDFAWMLLLRPEYVDLRHCIYQTEKELRRFRQVCVNCCLATDLHDIELQTLRKARWAKAFSSDSTAVATVQPTRNKPNRANTRSNDSRARRASDSYFGRSAEQTPKKTLSRAKSEEGGNSMLGALRRAVSLGRSTSKNDERPQDDANRKATIVMEHLMQAADISHCMQNWNVYMKWNERLFDEYYEAYEGNRCDEDPSTFWYENEINFFDSIVIPLAKKLANCGVFGDDGDEFIGAAFANRDEWESKGHAITKGYLEHYQELRKHQASKTANTEEESRDDNSNNKTLGSVGSKSKDISKHSSKQLSVDFAADGVSVDVAPSVSGASSIQSDGTDEDDAEDDPDIVYAVLDNSADPYDFDSYSLLTPKMKRKQEEKRSIRASIVSRTSMLTRATNDERVKRFIRRTYSSEGGSRDGDSTGGGSSGVALGGGSSHQSLGSHET